MVGGFEAIIPDSVTLDIKRTQFKLGEFETDLMRCLSVAEDPNVIAEMPPLHRAQFFLILAKSATALFTLRLRCRGIHPDDHAVRSENERLRLFEEKLNRYNKINKEQKTKMRDISKGTGITQNNHKKRKHRSQPENKSASVRAAEFLSKAAKEIVYPDNGGLKGPFAVLQCDSDEEGMQVE